jgi:hypothetical protein
VPKDVRRPATASKRVAGMLVTVPKRQDVRDVTRDGLEYAVQCGEDCRVSAVLRAADSGRTLGRAGRTGGGKLALTVDQQALAAAVRAARGEDVRAHLFVTVRAGDRVQEKRIAIKLR